MVKEHEQDLNKRDRSADNLDKNAKPQYDGKGECAAYVTNALKASDIDLRDIRDKKYNTLEDKTYAYKYGNYLTDEDVGFLQTASGGGGKNPKNYEPQKGDIAIFQPSETTSKYGHMQMYNGNNWVSDFNQINTEKAENMGAGIIIKSKIYINFCQRISYKCFQSFLEF